MGNVVWDDGNPDDGWWVLEVVVVLGIESDYGR